MHLMVRSKLLALSSLYINELHVKIMCFLVNIMKNDGMQMPLKSKINFLAFCSR